jgi:hypothetical protein
MIVRLARRALISASLAVLAAAAPAGAADRLSLELARDATRVAAVQIAAPFTETSPKVRVLCKRLAPQRARCRASVAGDRITATFTARVRLAGENVTVYAGQLRTHQR